MSQRPGDAGPDQAGLVRVVSAGDLDRLMEIEDLAFGSEAWTREMVKAEITGPYRRYVGAERDAGLIGYAGVFLGLDAAEIMTIAVDPAWRGRGCGRQLLGALLAAVRAAGLGRVMLEVAEGSNAAIGLYRSSGFEPIGRRRAYYQPSGRDAIVMRLDLGRR
ncbi:MAG: ribosomal protein S18-alanine N-acetyltransferase [Bifidobacteriaceae bacterium]|nr:ribosomal protein S18-alanine N-acetyltransferase [Bifidobacteriaceae bacterium]